MVFKYMVADTDLVNGQVTEPQTPPAHTPKTPIPAKKIEVEALGSVCKHAVGGQKCELLYFELIADVA